MADWLSDCSLSFGFGLARSKCCTTLALLSMWLPLSRLNSVVWWCGGLVFRRASLASQSVVERRPSPKSPESPALQAKSCKSPRCIHNWICHIARFIFRIPNIRIDWHLRTVKTDRILEWRVPCRWPSSSRSSCVRCQRSNAAPPSHQ